MLDGHDLAAEKNLAHGGRHAVAEAVHDGDKAHGADSPDQRGDGVVGQVVHQLGRLAEIGPGDDLHLGPGVKGGVQVLDRDVKIKGGLVAEDIVAVDAKNTGKLRDEIQHRAVADRDALGHAGTAAGKVDV